MGLGFLGGRWVRLVVGLAAGLIALSLGGLVSAQEGRPEVRMTVEGGIDGWVDPRWPITLTVRIESDILLVGELLVVQSQEVARLEVEAPAAGVKSYQVVVAPPTDQGAILLRLVADGAPDDEPVASAIFRPKTASDEILVGLDDLAALEQVLGEVRSAISGAPVTPVSIVRPLDRLDGGELFALSYLVLDRPRSLPDATVSWLEGGGRLITTEAALEALDLDVTRWGEFPGLDHPIGWYGIGDGEIVALETLFGHDSRTWARLLRPLPSPTGGQAGFLDGTLPLTQTALAVENETPSYPWLPLVVVGYAVVVGPLNIWILRRRRRLEWAWLTIPAFGLIGVAAFWIVGASGIDHVFWSHGTVQVAGPSGETRSGVVAASSRARTMEVSFDPGWVSFLEDPRSTGASVLPTITGSGLYQYDLPPLGWLTVTSFQRGQPLDMTVDFSGQGVQLNNNSGQVAIWGVHAHPKVAMGGPLASGGTGALSWREVWEAESWWAFGDAFWDVNITEGPEISHRNWPELIRNLGNLAQSSGMVRVPSFAFAVLEQPITYVKVDGSPESVPGLKLLLFPIGPDHLGDSGWAFPRPVKGGEGGIGVDPLATERGILSYRVPAGLAVAPEMRLGGLDPTFHRPPVFGDEEEPDEEAGWEAWDWEASEFVSFDINQAIDPLRFVAPSGEVMMRVSTARLELPVSLAAVLTWGDLP